MVLTTWETDRMVPIRPARKNKINIDFSLFFLAMKETKEGRKKRTIEYPTGNRRLGGVDYLATGLNNRLEQPWHEHLD